MLGLIALASLAQSAQPLRGVAYVKLDMESPMANGRSSSPLFQLSSDEILHYEPLKKSSSQMRQSKSVLDGLYKITFSSEKDVTQYCKELETYSNVRYAEPIYQEQQLYIPNDPSARNGDQDYLDIIKAFDAWDISRGDSSIVIGIIDSGIDFTHEDIADKVITNENDPVNGIDDDNNGYIDDYRGYDFADEDNDPQADKSFHGNRVAGVAAAKTDNEIGIAGTGFNSKIAALKIFRSTDNFSGGSYEAIVYAADQGYDVINLSWGSMDSYNQAAQDIITYAAVEKDVVIVAAAGNTPGNNRFYPASYEHVLSVAASNNDDSKAGFTSYNYDVDLMAPGSNIYSTFKENGYATDQGTSYSSPMVAGTAALVRHIYPELNALQVMERIRVTADPVYNISPNNTLEGMLGYGRLNMEQALAADSVRSIRITDFSYTNGSGPNAFYGDTITFSFKVKNYLAPTQNLTITLSSESEHITLLHNEFTIGQMETLGESFFTEKVIVLSENAPSSTSLLIKAAISDGTYLDHHYFELETNDDLVELSSGQIAVSLTGDGNIGYSGDGFGQGSGLTFNSQIVAANMGILFADNNDRVADNLPDPSGKRARDFIGFKPIKLTARAAADHLTISTFTDDSTSNPIGITVDQRTFTNDASAYLVFEYRVINSSNSPIDSIRGAIYMDWRLNNPNLNRCYYDSISHRLIALTSDSTLFAGLEFYQSVPGAFQAINLGGSDPDVVTFSDSIKHRLTFETQYDSAGNTNGGSDVASLLASPSYTMEVGEDLKMTFLLALGNSPEELTASLEAAHQAYAAFEADIPVLETFTSCSGASLTIDPASGELFRFYADAERKNLLAEDDTLRTGQITSDTTFYAVNIDYYPTELKKIVIKLVDDVATFEMSTDTLYLDQEVNQVTFTDRSFNATTWNWDFGNGTQSTNQNPTVIYADPGNYTITLSIQNDQGCAGTISKQLVVATRPVKPEIQAPTLCAGDRLSITATNTDNIAVYSSLNQKTPTATGSSLEIGQLFTDTVLYITNRSNGFESEKTRVVITVSNIMASFRTAPNLTTTDHQAWLIPTSSEASAISWEINGTPFDEDTLSMVASSTPINVKMMVANETGCKDTLNTTLTFSESPTPATASSYATCPGSAVKITPGNGTHFAFYADSSLADLIQKGAEIELQDLSTDTAIYIVGLDSMLPSAPVIAAITLHDTAFAISTEVDTLYLSERQTVQLSYQGSDLSDIAWYINQQFLDSSPAPTAFFQTSGSFEILATGRTVAGCEVQDSKQLIILTERPQETPLGVGDPVLSVYPNPAKTHLHISVREPSQVTFYNLSGKAVKSIFIENLTLVELTDLKKGVYLLVLDAPASGKEQPIRIILTH